MEPIKMKSKGSEWKKWDLHFHTPSSYDYEEKSVTSQNIINEMKNHGISAFAVTDHHVIDVTRIKELQKLGAASGITVIPGIEFLSDAKGKEPVHFIGLFSEQADIDFIWGEIKHNTEIKEIYKSSSKQNAVYCHLMDTIKVIKDNGGIVTIHAGDKTNSIENITHSLPHNMAQKTEIAKAVDIYELGKESDKNGYDEIVFPKIGKYIPMIICSDNHNVKKYKIKQNLWIKGSPNFEGLKYALNEPQNRFFIGEEPISLKRVRENKTKYLKSITIKRTGRKDPSNTWFENVEIPLNSELVTIIGNKGSGKSALSDIIALCSDAEHHDDFLFLHKTKFKRKGLADRFSASLKFESDISTEGRQLDHQIDESQQRLVRYLPQSYFEKVCNEVGKIEAFRDEIEKVVFQYVPIHKRLNSSSFGDLINLKKSAIDREIHHLIEEVAELNNDIILLEDKSNPEHKKNLLSKKRVKDQELLVHISSKPPVQVDPAQKFDSEENKKKKADLKEWDDKKKHIEKSIEDIEKNISERSLAIEEISGIKRDIKNKHDDILSYIERQIIVANKNGLDLSGIVKINIDYKSIDDKIKSLNEQNTIQTTLIEEEKDISGKSYDCLNLRSKLQMCKTEIASIQGQFSGEQKIFQVYLDSLSEWQKIKLEIEGDKDKVGSLAHINSNIEYIEKQLHSELYQLRSLRLSKSKEIHSKKSEIKSFYDEIKNEIDHQLSTSSVTGLIIASAFYVSGDFKTSILRNIMQNRSGSFYGTEDGATLLQEILISPTDWNTTQGLENFLKTIIEYLEQDMRNAGPEKPSTYIGDLVKNRKEMYNYLFSLDYLEPHYDLQQNGKSLEQLSPGEKGALLLVFYLVLDKEDIPLIIDQPEDNLDNNSVAKVLVPFIKEAKEKRQIIMVTHNPNLAVVSDSEQIIRVGIDKESGNVFTFISGGIENKKIKDEIVDVLEGTIPAFTTRKDKYQIT
jgi:ABC-type lipoprotein export system ATPase subunit